MNDFKFSTETSVNGATTGLESEFRFEDFRINQDFVERLDSRRKPVDIPLKKPDPQWWVYFHPNLGFDAYVLDDRENERSYLVAPALVTEIRREIVPKRLVGYATRGNSVCLWPIRLPDEGGRLDTYNDSALTIVEKYQDKWIRVPTNRQQKRYDVCEPVRGDWPPPKWPDGGIDEIVKLAFQHRTICTLEHPTLRALRGEI